MRSYFAMIWDEENPIANQVAKNIELRAETQCKRTANIRKNGFSFYNLSDYPKENSLIGAENPGINNCIIFGTVFERLRIAGKQSPLTHLNEVDVFRTCQSEGGTIVTDFWGSYIAFIKSNYYFTVVADPTSSIPCFYTIQENVTFIFSHLEKCVFLDKLNLSINYRFIEKLLAYDKIQTGETGFTEVNELLGGQRLRINNKSMLVDYIWDPREIACDIHELPAAQAAEELKETTKAVIQSCAIPFEKVTVQLSGGLDSSIVLACLTDSTAKIDVNSIHYIVNSSDLSEKKYAEIASDHSQSELIKVILSSNETILDTSNHPLSVRPHRAYVSRSLLSYFDESESNIGDGVFTGQGGDHLFLESTSSLGFADYLKLHGLRNYARSELLNSSILSGKSIWHVLLDTIPYVVWKTSDSSILKNIEIRRTLINQHAASSDAISADLPHWVTRPMGLPPAKFDQINSLLHMIQVREVVDSSGMREIVHPLISQPLIELCLRLPSYLLCANGQSRGLARMAFTGVIPEKICRRMTKGSASRYFIDNISVNHKRILDKLINGELVNCGLIQRSDLEIFFHNSQYRFKAFGRMLLVYYAIEAWLSAWKRMRADTA